MSRVPLDCLRHFHRGPKLADQKTSVLCVQCPCACKPTRMDSAGKVLETFLCQKGNLQNQPNGKICQKILNPIKPNTSGFTIKHLVTNDGTNSFSALSLRPNFA